MTTIVARKLPGSTLTAYRVVIDRQETSLRIEKTPAAARTWDVVDDEDDSYLFSCHTKAHCLSVLARLGTIYATKGKP